MNNFEKHIKKAGANVHLSDAEKARMKSVLQGYMRFHPLPEPVTTYTITRDWTLFLYRPLAASLVLVLVVGSGISYAAEGALPGDALYSVKTAINEPVKVALASSAEEKAEVEIELAERRIQEATALAADDRLDEITEAKLAVALDAHAESAATLVEEVDEDDAGAAAELSTRFETRLRAREDVLAEVRTTRAEIETSVERSIRTASSRVALLRERSEVRLALAPAIGGSLEETAAPVATTMAMKAVPEAAPSPEAASLAFSADMAVEAIPTATPAEPAVERGTAERIQRSAESKLKAVKKLARSSEKARDDLEHAEDLLEEGEDHLDNADYAAAFFSFRASLEQSERVSVFLDSANVLEKSRSRRDKSDDARNGESDERDDEESRSDSDSSGKESRDD